MAKGMTRPNKFSNGRRNKTGKNMRPKMTTGMKKKMGFKK